MRFICSIAVAMLAGSVVSVAAADEKAPFYPDKSKLLLILDQDGKERPVKTAVDWAVRRQHILLNMQEVMGPLPARDESLPLDMKVIEEVKLDKAVRKKITYVAEKDDRISAYLFIPLNVTGKVPGVLCLHPTNRQLGKGVVAGLGGLVNRAYALELAERGYVTLAPDYPNSGDHPFDTYKRGYVSATMKAIRDNMRGIDLLSAMAEVDAGQIGCIGHSLGGHNTLFTAVFDQRIKALVSCCGFTAFARYKGGDLTGWCHDGYMPRIASVYNKDPKKMPFDFHEVVAALAPRPFLAVAPEKDSNFDVTGVREVIASAATVYQLLGAADNLKALYPDCGHDFPPEARAAAYALFDKHLKGKGSSKYP